ncbi:MAG: PQQ-dependent sugar dehydrogenase [Pyrinomonadaceae bacterium MAG19_C2-C3]|nr:PQQ-dependent sugar dehydrogenase [Pyrinomonadaceae bacterium MAG19_C2-C3]
MKQAKGLAHSFMLAAVCLILVTGACAANSNEDKKLNADEVFQTADGKVRFRVETVTGNLEVPWSLAWKPDGSMLIAERKGRVRVFENGKLRSEPLYVVPDVEPSGENGLMGMTLHPRFAENGFVYLAYAYDGDGKQVKVVRLRERDGKWDEPKIIISEIPAARYHAGTRLRFGADGKLYITTGDATNGDQAQRLESLGGKTLRLNDDGTIPNDNPFINHAQFPNARPEIWSYGHRNAQGLDFHPDTGMMVQTEHGPSFPLDGLRGGDDEVNIVERGKNYGWNKIRGDKKRDGMESPLLVYKKAIAPASGMFYRLNKSETGFPQFRGDYFFGALKGESLIRIVFDGARVVGQERLLENKFGRIREVAESPDGTIYFTTSNRDGRGSPTKNDDRVMRIVPVK